MILLLDERFLERQYQEVFPREWDKNTGSERSGMLKKVCGSSGNSKNKKFPIPVPLQNPEPDMGKTDRNTAAFFLKYRNGLRTLPGREIIKKFQYSFGRKNMMIMCDHKLPCRKFFIRLDNEKVVRFMWNTVIRDKGDPKSDAGKIVQSAGHCCSARFQAQDPVDAAETDCGEIRLLYFSLARAPGSDTGAVLSVRVCRPEVPGTIFRLR